MFVVGSCTVAATGALATSGPRATKAGVADVALANVKVQLSASRALDPPASVLGATVTRGPETPSTAAPAPAAVSAPAARAGAPRLLPFGKGMWLHQLSMAGNDPNAVVAQAKAVGLTHVYLRTGSSKSGFYAQDELNRLLPAAHAAGIKVIGWDFPYLFDPIADANRAKEMTDYTTPTGDRMDGFSADVETENEGVNVNPGTADAYSKTLRQLVGPEYPLIATVPRQWRGFPYLELIRNFDAVAPMVYWMGNDPAATVSQVMDNLAVLGKPIMPVGQAYDGALDHGPPGAPSKAALDSFMNAAAGKGALGVSFWVWHLATPEEWTAIAGDHHFEVPPMVAGPNDAGRVTFLQRVLNVVGGSGPVDGRFAEPTRAAVIAVQRRLGLPPTGDLDPSTVAALFRLR